MSVMEHKARLGGAIEFHRARLIALDNWHVAETALTVGDDPVRAVSRALGVTDLGAHAVISMLRGQRPDRAQVVHEIQRLERLEAVARKRADVRRRWTVARTGARRALA
ncbi:MAG TPA: hypothetical protein VK059_09540 [Nocardioidaceae bacterium]|nr:hypothetical protein [Nocardioidaceae bacterium]